ncbi:M28 family metallopeptidase [Porifericola rhodea]|uniref:M28 family metallopeptidase n=1 Tax=Porifericola rhodea TaxID=930972 RepID=UPI002664FDF7|nr:M28 family metallopeptidase [Porifericola rhodea]WKN30616.1 M28 family metallopeptidase [Porifericola rhodea]
MNIPILSFDLKAHITTARALSLLLMPLFIACSSEQNSVSQYEVEIDTTQFKKHITRLASDEFEGRMPFSEGEKKTVAYLEQEFINMGLEPGNGDSYLQEVPLVEIDAVPTTDLKINSSDEQISLRYRNDFVALTRRVTEQVYVEDSELVFCGFGIVAPEYDWNDYEGIDMRGKTAVVLVNDPGFGSDDTTFFKGNTMTYYGRWTYKYEEAARQGAEGVIIVHDTAPAGYPWGVVRSSWTGKALYLQSDDDNMSRCAFEGWINNTAARQIFSKAKISNYLGQAREQGFKPIPMNMTVSVALEASYVKASSPNVVAKLEGNKHSDEYIIYSAHWDHIGINEAVEGDSIYNGALDNASGVAAMLEIARAFSELPEKPERSIVFIAVTAEEQGLLGSAYYAEQPIYPIEKTVANINMDGIWFLGSMKDVTVVGYGQSELDEYISEAAAQQGRYVIPDPQPEKGYFFRSDHFNFAKVGIPALYASGESDHRQNGKAWTEQKNSEWTQKHYHQPSDEYVPEEWSFDGMAQDAELLFNVGYRLSNERYFPEWKSGSEFKTIRESYMQQ